MRTRAARAEQTAERNLARQPGMQLDELEPVHSTSSADEERRDGEEQLVATTPSSDETKFAKSAGAANPSPPP
jgi:hypothetical protein